MLSADRANKILAHEFGVAPFAAPANYYIGLSTTAIADDEYGKGVGYTEPTNDGYARVVVPANATNWQVEDRELTNKLQLEFPVLTSNPTGGSSGTATHWFLSEHPAGHQDDCAVYYGELSKSRPLVEDSEIILKAGALSIRRENQT